RHRPVRRHRPLRRCRHVEAVSPGRRHRHTSTPPAPPRASSPRRRRCVDGQAWYEGGVATRLLRAPSIAFGGIPRELGLPHAVTPAAQSEADAAAAAVVVGPRPGTTDRTDIPLVTIDPATSRDLDQAMCLHRLGGGYRVFYAIADVTSFVSLGG